MSVRTNILKFIKGIRLGELFTTRQLLGLGNRNSIDQQMYLMVKSELIVRVCRGVFMRAGSERPSIEDVAKIKVESFGKQILMSGAEAACRLNFPHVGTNTVWFVSNGRTSEFQFDGICIRIVGRSPRKLHLADSPAGQVIRAMWHIGKERLTDDLIEKTYYLWSNTLTELRASASLLADWMNCRFSWGRKVATDAAPMKSVFPDLKKLLPEYADLFAEVDRDSFGGESWNLL